MTFSEMASMTGGGVQTPALWATASTLSPQEVMRADGGIKRIVWMPRPEGSGIRKAERDRQGALRYRQLHRYDRRRNDYGKPEELLTYLPRKITPYWSSNRFIKHRLIEYTRKKI
jgi:hypothetical protein